MVTIVILRGKLILQSNIVVSNDQCLISKQCKHNRGAVFQGLVFILFPSLATQCNAQSVWIA